MLQLSFVEFRRVKPWICSAIFNGVPFRRASGLALTVYSLFNIQYKLPDFHPASKAFSYGTHALYLVIKDKAKRDKRGSARRLKNFVGNLPGDTSLWHIMVFGL